MPMTDAEWERWKGRFRDVVIILLGMIMAVNEFFIREEPRDLAVIVIGGALGLPLVLAGASKIGGGNGKAGGSGGPPQAG